MDTAQGSNRPLSQASPPSSMEYCPVDVKSVGRNRARIGRTVSGGLMRRTKVRLHVAERAGGGSGRARGQRWRYRDAACTKQGAREQCGGKEKLQREQCDCPREIAGRRGQIVAVSCQVGVLLVQGAR